MERMLVIEDDRALYKPLQHVFEADGFSLDFRQKLEADSENPRHFKTVHGARYKFVP